MMPDPDRAFRFPITRRPSPVSTQAIGGPLGYAFVVPDDFDWYLFIGDETALPAIGRRLEELRTGARAIVVAAVAGPEEEQTFESRADIETIWVRRPLSRAEDPAPLASMPVIARRWRCRKNGTTATPGRRANRNTAKLCATLYVDERGLDKAWIKAAGYWKRGAVSIHETHND